MSDPQRTTTATPAPTPAQAPAPAGPKPAPADADARYKRLSEELRCLVCQNQTLADSNADLAADLREQVRELIASGRDDEQVKDYLVQRYGEFVLYRPRLSRTNLLLWGGPFALLGIGGTVWWLVQRRQRRAAGTLRHAAPSPRAPHAGTDRASADDRSRERSRESARRLLD